MTDMKKPLLRANGSPSDLDTTLTRWRKRAEDGPTYVDHVVARRFRRDTPRAFVDAAAFLHQGNHPAVTDPPPLADVGDVIAEPCPSCGGPLTVYQSIQPDSLLVECQNVDCSRKTRKVTP